MANNQNSTDVKVQNFSENQVKVFNFNLSNQQIRIEIINDKPWFVAKDVCSALSISNDRDAVSRLDDDERRMSAIPTPSGKQEMNLVSESGLYNLIFRSNKPEAHAFRKWVTSEVLPAIRKTGGYIVSTPDDTPELIMARALQVAQSTINRHKAQLEQAHNTIQLQAPKVLFADAVATSDRACLVSELAKTLKQNGIEMGQNRLFDWMRHNGYLCKKGEYYNQPTQKAMEQGLFEIKKTTVNKPDGSILVSCTTKVTGKGQIYFVNKFLTA